MIRKGLVARLPALPSIIWKEFYRSSVGGISSSSGLETRAIQSRSQTGHPGNITKKYRCDVNPWGRRSPSSIYNSILEESIPTRSYVTSQKKEQDGQAKVSQASLSTPLEMSTDPTSGIDGTGNETSFPSENVVVDSAFKASPRHDMALLFTCMVCDVRSAKTMSRATYETGVVIVRCPGCQNLHLIADRYGWFGETGSVEDFLAEKGVDVRKGSDSSYEFSLEDMSGWSPKEKSEQ